MILIIQSCTIEIIQIIPTITNETRYQIYLGSFCIFSFKISIIHIVISIKAKVNIILLEFGSKNTPDKAISNGISEINTKNYKGSKIFFPISCFKKTFHKEKRQKAEMLFFQKYQMHHLYAAVSLLHSEKGISVLYLRDPQALIKRQCILTVPLKIYAIYPVFHYFYPLSVNSFQFIRERIDFKRLSGYRLFQIFPIACYYFFIPVKTFLFTSF